MITPCPQCGKKYTEDSELCDACASEPSFEEMHGAEYTEDGWEI